ncbi:MAG: LysR family transcriptional regulator [Mangrovicoccus sp.]
MADQGSRISLWGVEIFVAIAEERAISAAARRVGASPSAVSQQLTNLEHILGAALVDRTARPLGLTAAGETFLRRATTILNETALARAELGRGDLGGLSRFRLGMIEDFDADVTPRLLFDMAGSLRRCQFLLETGASHHLFSQLDSRGLDVIVSAEIGQNTKGLETHPILSEPFVAAVPVTRAMNPVHSIADLGDLPLIHYTQRHHMGQVISAHLAQSNIALDHRFELDSYHAIMAMVAQGAGWTILTPLGFLRAQRFMEAVTMIPLPLPPLSRRITLTARQEILGDMPAQTANRLRPIVQDLIVTPAQARFPWLGASLTVLGLPV